MSLPATDWPPPAPGLSTFLEIAEPRDFKWFLRRYARWILLSGLLAAFFGIVWAEFFPPRFVSKATVRFLPPQVAGRFVNPNFSMEVGQRLFALSQLLGSRLTAAKLIEACSLYPERRRFETIEDLTARFNQDLQITQVGNLAGDDQRSVPTLQVSFSYSDPQTAKKVIQKLVEQIYEENRKYRGDQSLGTTEFLEEQLTASEEKVIEAEQRLGDLQDAIGITISQTRLGQATSRSYVIDSRLRDLRHDSRLLEERKDNKKAEWEQLELLQRRIETRPAEFYIPEFEAMPHYWHIKAQLVAANANYERLRERFQDQIPEVVTAKNLVAEVESTIEKFHRERGTRLRNRDLEANAAKIALAKLELQALNKQSAEQSSEESELRAEAQRLRDGQRPPEGLEVELLVAKREYEAVKDRHSDLLKKFEESKAASEMERRGQGESVELLEPASMPSTAEWPNWWMRIAIAFLLGTFGSALLFLAHVLRRPLVLHAGHVERWAGLPVLATFSPLESANPRKTRRWLTAFSLFAILILSGCSGWKQSAAQLCQQGVAAEREGRIPLALLHYRQALQRDARHAPAHAALARISLRMGELEAAREALARAVELDPNQQPLVRQLADLTYQLYFGDPGRPTTLLREVEALGERLRRDWPMLPDGYRVLAQVLMERHRTDEAILLLEASAKKVDRNESLLAQMAAALARTGQGERAGEILQDLIENRPNYRDAYDLFYLQLMRDGRSEDARQILAAKWRNLQEIDAALQLAAHDDAHGNMDLAASVLSQARQVAAQIPLGWARLGDFWLQRARYSDAEQLYREGISNEPSRRADYIGRLAEWHLVQNQASAARKLVESELAQNPASPLLAAYAAAVRLGELPPARRVEERKRLEAILQRMPDSPFVRYHLGRAYLLEANPQPALEHFEQSVKLDPNYAAGWLALAEMELSRGNSVQAEARANSLLQRLPGHGRALLVRAQAQVGRGKMADAAKSLNEVLSREPKNLDARYLLAIANARQGNTSAAWKSLADGISREPENPRWLIAQAALKFREGKPDEARQLLEKGAQGKSADPTLQLKLAFMQLELQDGQGARQSLERLQEKAPGNFEVKLALAAAHAMAGDLKQALARYASLRENHPTDIRVWLQPAALLEEKGRAAEALPLYEQSLRLDPNQPVALNNLAWLLLNSQSDPQRALELAQRAKRLSRQSPEVDGTLAGAYLQLGMYRNASAIYEEMLSYLPGKERPRIQKMLVESRLKEKQERKS